MERDENGRWLPGIQSPNPSGRPRGPGFLAELERQLAAEDDRGRPAVVRLAERLLTAALGGDMRAMEILLKRVAPEKLAIGLQDDTASAEERIAAMKRGRERAAAARAAREADSDRSAAATERE